MCLEVSGDMPGGVEVKRKMEDSRCEFGEDYSGKTKHSKRQFVVQGMYSGRFRWVCEKHKKDFVGAHYGWKLVDTFLDDCREALKARKNS